MVRYPHTATIKIEGGSKDANGDFITNSSETPIEGRYEPAAQKKALDYSGKFYSNRLNFQPFQLEGQKLIYESIEFEIVQFHNYQNSCELWLK